MNIWTYPLWSKLWPGEVKIAIRELRRDYMNGEGEKYRRGHFQHQENGGEGHDSLTSARRLY